MHGRHIGRPFLHKVELWAPLKIAEEFTFLSDGGCWMDLQRQCVLHLPYIKRWAQRIPDTDCLSFMRFLGLQLEDKVPDANTVWLFRKRIKEMNLMETLFSRFHEQLAQRGYVARAGQMIDATFVEAPKHPSKQRYVYTLSKWAESHTYSHYWILP